MKSTGRAAIPQAVTSVFGKEVADVIGSAPEVWVTAGASSQDRGVSYRAAVRVHAAQVAIMRMADPEGARRAVQGLSSVIGTKAGSGSAKVETAVPGYADALAYTETYPLTGDFISAFAAHGRYVIGVYGTMSVDQIRSYFDRQMKALDGFQPTPVGKMTTLQRDASGLARLTLAPAENNSGFTLSARSAVLGQTDVARAERLFGAAGVDAVGVGASNVYRAKDAAGAQYVMADSSAETRTAFPTLEEETVKGVPGGTCMTFANVSGSSSKLTWCMVVVGRYVAEFASAQRAEALQGIGAAYLILQGAK